MPLSVRRSVQNTQRKKSNMQNFLMLKEVIRITEFLLCIQELSAISYSFFGEEILPTELYSPSYSVIKYENFQIV
jgi:hypothetical protein